MNTQSHRIDPGTLLPEPGSRFKRRYEACRQTLSNRGHATARPACASISKSTATRSNGGRVNLPGSHPGKLSPMLAGERSASLFSAAIDPVRQSQSQALLIRQALGGFR